MLVAEGQQVRRGQPLATLDLREIDAQVCRRAQRRHKAERDLERAEALYADSVATLAQVQDARTGAEVARSGLQAAAFNRRYATIVAPADGVVLRRLAAGRRAGEPRHAGASSWAAASGGRCCAWAWRTATPCA